MTAFERGESAQAGSFSKTMVGRLTLQNVSADDPLGMSYKAERTLDSPDSGLPPSPSAWLQALSTARRFESPVSEDESRAEQLAPGIQEPATQLLPLSYGEGIELVPLPPKEIRYTSSVRYDSDRHFIHDVRLQPTGLGLEWCSQTVLALPHSTWRRYKTLLELQPRQRAHRYRSTTIVYPKHAQTIFTTELHYDERRLAKRFLSSVELESTDSRLVRMDGRSTPL
ncbi:refilin-B isoform X2 [Paramormyrops kingsleyae]|uniref:refilin-B isoform X2 n=1 Tax=Paramormyrops kingsleyae TaxID=1676925 RepID=UPI000CD62CA4|nr:refilin-B-like isoform X2 [Paramormyrops kingsleyae]